MVHSFFFLFLILLFFFNFKFIYLSIYFWLCWVSVSVRGLSPVAASGDHPSSRCAGLSLSRPLLLRSTGSRCAGSVVVAHGPSRSAACGIFPDQGPNLCPLHWQADSQPLCHQGSPSNSTFIFVILFFFPPIFFPEIYQIIFHLLLLLCHPFFECLLFLFFELFFSLKLYMIFVSLQGEVLIHKFSSALLHLLGHELFIIIYLPFVCHACVFILVAPLYRFRTISFHVIIHFLMEANAFLVSPLL